MDKYVKKPRKSSGATRPVAFKMDYDYCCTQVIMMAFKLLGLGPWTIVRTSSGRKVSKNVGHQTLLNLQLNYSVLGSLYHIFIAVFTIAIIYVSLPLMYDSDYPFKTQLTETIEFIQAVCGNLVVIAIRILFCVKQNTIVKLFNHFANVDRTIASLANDRGGPKLNRFFILALFLTNTVIWIMITITEARCYGHRPLLSYFNDVCPVFIINWFVMQYVVVVKIVENRFRALNRAILDSPDRTSIPQPILSLIHGEISPNNTRCTPKIVTFRRTHILLYEIACDISEFYSLPILMTTGLLSFSVIYNSYYLLMPVVMQTEFQLICVIINATVSLAGLMLPIVMLAAGVNKITAEMRRTADVVHKLLARSTTSREDNAELQQFSLELLQRNVQFTAYGLFSLDCTLVHSIFSMVVTYLIILFQFQLTEEKSSLRDVTESNSTA